MQRRVISPAIKTRNIAHAQRSIYRRYAEASSSNLLWGIRLRWENIFVFLQQISKRLLFLFDEHSKLLLKTQAQVPELVQGGRLKIFWTVVLAGSNPVLCSPYKIFYLACFLFLLVLSIGINLKAVPIPIPNPNPYIIRSPVLIKIVLNIINNNNNLNFR